MADQHLVEYIQRKINGGGSRESIKATLMKAGWPEMEIEESFKKIEQSVAMPTTSDSSKEPGGAQILYTQSYSPSVQIPFKAIIITLITFLLIVLMGVGVYWYMNRSRTVPTPIISDEGGIKSDGINPAILTIRHVDVTSSWSDDQYVPPFSGQSYLSVSFSVKKAYLTPDIADIGHFRDNFSIGTKNIFLVVEVDVRNNSVKSEERRMVSALDYLKVVDSNTGIEAKPVAGGNLYVDPQENRKEFVVFVVDKNLTQATLKSGLSGSLTTSALNFFDDNAKVFNGVFLSKSGLADIYSE